MAKSTHHYIRPAMELALSIGPPALEHQNAAIAATGQGFTFRVQNSATRAICACALQVLSIFQPVLFVDLFSQLQTPSQG